MSKTLRVSYEYAIVAVVSVGASCFFAGTVLGWGVMYTRTPSPGIQAGLSPVADTPAQKASPGLRASGVSESREGVKWTYRDLAEHLTANGVPTKLVPTNRGMALVNSTTKWEDAGICHMVENGLQDEALEYIRVRRFDNTESARLNAGNSDRKNAWQWGCFVFYAADVSRGLVPKVKTILGS
jgi:hypothetical protein